MILTEKQIKEVVHKSVKQLMERRFANNILASEKVMDAPAKKYAKKYAAEQEAKEAKEGAISEAVYKEVVKKLKKLNG